MYKVLIFIFVFVFVWYEGSVLIMEVIYILEYYLKLCEIKFLFFRKFFNRYDNEKSRRLYIIEFCLLVDCWRLDIIDFGIYKKK